MDYEFTYYHEHIVNYARFIVIGTLTCLWGLTISFIGAGMFLIPIFNAITMIAFIFGLSFELVFMLFERPDKTNPESKRFFYQLLAILTFTTVGSLLYVIDFSLRSYWLSWVVYLVLTFLAQKWLLAKYMSLMREARIRHFFHFTRDRLEKYTGDLKTFDASLSDLTQISFVDEWVLVGEGGGSNTFNLYFFSKAGKIEDMTLTWTKITAKIADFIFFIQELCHDSGILFTQTLKCGNRNDPIDDLQWYLSPEKKHRDRVLSVLAGLAACNFFVVPLVITLLPTHDPAMICTGIILAAIFWVIVPCIYVKYSLNGN